MQCSYVYHNKKILDSLHRSGVKILKSYQYQACQVYERRMLGMVRTVDLRGVHDSLKWVATIPLLLLISA